MQNIEKRALLAVGLSLLILFVWQRALVHKSPRKDQPTTVKKSETPLEARKDYSQPIKVSPDLFPKKEEETIVDTQLYQAVFSTHNAGLKSLKLKKYRDKIGPEGKWIEMVSIGSPADHYPLSLFLTLPGYSGKSGFHYKLASKSPSAISYVYEDKTLKIERAYVFYDHSYKFSHQIKIWYADQKAQGDIFIGISEGFPEHVQKNIFLAPYQDVRNFIYHTQDKTVREKFSKDNSQQEVKQVVQWAGVENRYFVSALINRSSIRPYLAISKPFSGMGTIDLKFPFYRERGNDFFQLETDIYFGPKVVEHLKLVEPSFSQTVDFGIFSVLCIPLLKTMNFFYKYIGNYGIAILLLTLLIRILFHPLTKKSLQSMREMQRLQPQIAKIKEKLKDDRQRMNKEIMELMRANKVNPLGGCLPLLFQMPIFFALYRVLYNAIELYHAPFFGWIQDLSAKDPWFITPVLMGIAMFFQQKLTPTATVDPTQRKMMMMMPIIFSFFMIPLPSGLVLYILFSTVLQVAAQIMVNRELAKKAL